MAAQAYPNTAKKIQVKGSGGIFLFPRVRTADITVAANDTAIFDSNDKLKIAYIPVATAIRATGTADDSSVATEAAVRSAISAVEQGLAGTVNSVTGDADQPVWANPTSGAVIIGCSSANGTGNVKGYVATSNVAIAGDFSTVFSLSGIVSTANNATSTYVVPTLKTLHDITSKLIEYTNSKATEAAGAGVTSIKGTLPLKPTAATSGAVTMSIDYATTAQSGAVTLATSAQVYSATDKGSVVPTLATLNRYNAATRITSVYATAATTTGITDGDIVLVKSGTSVGVWAYVGNAFSKVTDTMMNTGILYKQDTGVAYVKNVVNTTTTYVPLVKSCGDYLNISDDGKLTLTTAASNAIAHGADNKITSVGAAHGLTGGGNADSTATTVTVSGQDVKNLATLTTSTDALIAGTYGVVQTINDLSDTGITAAQTAAVTTGKIYTAATFSTALSNNIVPTVNAIQNACLFYSEI